MNQFITLGEFTLIAIGSVILYAFFKTIYQTLKSK
jgi:hypothetical protein